MYLFVGNCVILVLRPTPPRFIKGARVAAPSVCFAAARILLAAAPTAPPCFRHWRRSSPLHIISASGLTDSTRTASPTKRKAPGEVATPWGLFFLVYRMEYPHNSIFSICHSPQKSSVAQKVYKPAAFILQVPHTRACYDPSASAKRPAHRHLLRPAWHPPG